MRSLVRLLAVMGILALLGCSSAAHTPSAVVARVPAASLRSSMETAAVHASMLQYLATHHRQVVVALTQHEFNPPHLFDPDISLSTATAQASRLGTPVPYWGYNASLVPSAGADPWLGVVPALYRHEYLVPVMTTSAPVATLAVSDMPHFWTLLLDWNYASMAASAAPAVERELGPGYEWGYLRTTGALWMIAHNRGHSAGIVLQDYSRDETQTGTPRGVLTGGTLDWWLAHPYGS